MNTQTLNWPSFNARVCAWNALRYEQQFDLDLTIGMIQEEVDEFQGAIEIADHIDALADIIYIATGAIWKLNIPFDETTITGFKNYYLHEDTSIVQVVPQLCNIMRNFQGKLQLAVMLHQIIAVCFDYMHFILIGESAVYKVFAIVCDSNDTKSVKNIPTGAKYSSEGKGQEYVPPEARLNQLILELTNETKH